MNKKLEEIRKKSYTDWIEKLVKDKVFPEYQEVGRPHYYKGFEDGFQAVIGSDEVKGLVRALKLYERTLTKICEKDGRKFEGFLQKQGRRALKKWEGKWDDRH